MKSTALLFGSRVKLILRAFAFATICLMALAGVLNGNGVWFFAISCGGTACHIIWQQCTWDEYDVASCAAKFKVTILLFVSSMSFLLGISSPMET